MIPYPDLVAALERWRLRNGLPVGGGGMPSMSSMSASTPAPAPAPSWTPAPAGPRTAPPMAAPVGAKVPTRVQTEDPVALADDDVLDEDMLSSEGGDFAMAFGVSSAKPVDTPSYEDDEVPEEKTAIGLPDHGAAPTTSPFSQQTHPGFDTLDADGEILDESDDPDHHEH